MEQERMSWEEDTKEVHTRQVRTGFRGRSGVKKKEQDGNERDLQIRR